MDIKKIFVVGAGQMGGGIAQVSAAAGFAVIMSDVDEERVKKGFAAIGKNLARMVEKGKISDADRDAVLARIKTTTSLADAAFADYIIEAAVENIKIKSAIFKELDQVCHQEAILASNTSSLPITEIAALTSRPEQVIGMHFMNPVPLMKLVEVISGHLTSEAVVQTTVKLAEKLQKTPVVVNDYPGFVSNRVLMPMINEAIYCVYEGIADPVGIDEVMKLGMNHPMGPLALADLIGLDTCLAIMEVLFQGFGDSKYRPCPLLRRYVKADLLGRKTGRGFYSYG